MTPKSVQISNIGFKYILNANISLLEVETKVAIQKYHQDRHKIKGVKVTGGSQICVKGKNT